MEESLIGQVAQLTREEKITLMSVVAQNYRPDGFQHQELAQKLQDYGQQILESAKSEGVSIPESAFRAARAVTDLIFPQPYQDPATS